jgi:AraC family transcriptional regulator
MLTQNHVLYATSRFHHWSGVGALSLKSFTHGHADYAVGAGRYRVDVQSYLVLNHGQDYTVTVETETATTSFCLFFAPGLAEEVLAGLTTPPGRLLDDPAIAGPPITFFEQLYRHDDLVSPYLFAVRDHYPQHQGDDLWLQERCHGLMARLLQVQDQVWQQVASVPAMRAATREELYRRLRRAYDFIAASYDQPITLEAMARVAALSPNHFLRTFRRLFHQTPHQVLTAQRLAQAQHLLRTTDDSVTTICFAVGFESVGSFSWLFHRRFGCSPQQFRRQSHP